MTQAQRRKELAKARAVVNRLEDEIARFEPLTPAQEEVLALIAEAGMITEWFDGWGLSVYRVGDAPNGKRLPRPVVWALQRRKILPEHPSTIERRVKSTYLLTDWGKKVAGSLAKPDTKPTDTGEG